MVKFIRVLVILAVLWSLAATGVVLLFGAALSMTDRFNGDHSATFAAIALAEALLLFLLYRAYRLPSLAVAFGLLAWFLLAAALQPHSAFNLRTSLEDLTFLLTILAPVSGVMLFLGIYPFVSRRKAE